MYLFICFYLFLFVFSLFREKFIPFVFPIFLFAYPVNLPYINWGGIGIDDLFLIISSFLSLNKLKNAVVDSWFYKNLIVLFVYIFGIILGLLFVERYSFEIFFKSLVSYFYIIAIIINVKCYIKKYSYIIFGFIFALFLQAIYSILVFKDPTSFSYIVDVSDYMINDSVIRASGTYNGPWELGGVIAIGSLFVFYLIDDMHGVFQKIVLLIVFLIMLYSLILTNSRSSWLFFIVSVFFLILSNKTKHVKYILFFCLIIVFFVDYNPLLESITSRIHYTFANNELDSSSSSRIDIWFDILSNITLPSVVFGYGNIYFYELFNYTPHNSYLAVFCYSGVLGIIVFFRYFYFVLSFFWNKIEAKFVLSLLLGFMFYSLTVDSLFTQFVLYTLVYVFSILYYKYYL